jgi:DNA-binding transcriptional LysR family regulator
MRSLTSGRVRHWVLQDVAGTERTAHPPETIVVNDPAAMREAAKLGLGVAMLAVPDVISDVKNGSLVGVLPRWYADAGLSRSTMHLVHSCPPKHVVRLHEDAQHAREAGRLDS